MTKFSLFAIKKLYFKLIFNSISTNYDRLFSQKNFDYTQLRGVCPEAWGFCPAGFCPGVYFLEPPSKRGFWIAKNYKLDKRGGYFDYYHRGLFYSNVSFWFHFYFLWIQLSSLLPLNPIWTGPKVFPP